MLHDVVIDEIKTTDGEVIEFLRIVDNRPDPHGMAAKFLRQDLESWLEWSPPWAIDSLRD